MFIRKKIYKQFFGLGITKYLKGIKLYLTRFSEVTKKV